MQLTFVLSKRRTHSPVTEGLLMLMTQTRRSSDPMTGSSTKGLVDCLEGRAGDAGFGPSDGYCCSLQLNSMITH